MVHNVNTYSTIYLAYSDTCYTDLFSVEIQPRGYYEFMQAYYGIVSVVWDSEIGLPAMITEFIS